VAYGKVKTTTTYAYSYNAPWLNYSGSDTLTDNHFQVGWALGAGVEYALGNNWSLKGEYLHVDFGSVDTTYTCSGCTTSVVTSARATNDIFRIGANYRF
jgi:opacity protein-like surface antigen